MKEAEKKKPGQRPGQSWEDGSVLSPPTIAFASRIQGAEKPQGFWKTEDAPSAYRDRRGGCPAKCRFRRALGAMQAVTWLQTVDAHGDTQNQNRHDDPNRRVRH